ncbi:MAG: hypothetical protein FWD17_01650 [Polyangiaceae bacterium]|nr:hypothetical protein [Polyangiaceae bacterium]
MPPGLVALLLDGAPLIAVLGTSAAITALVKRRWARQVAARLAEIDAGALCPACNGRDIDVAGDGYSARCRGCGRTIDLRALRKATFDASTIANVRDFPRGGREGYR